MEANHGFGCGIVNLKSGQNVLNLGYRVGFDVFLAAR
ncbi:hypothetical protein JOC26_002131 [Sporohalobacter salinus]|nr:hypothetical protein [Sporohalobacter salinus]